ncbi:MAG TPA: head GIN domain-containing protein [Lacibacter sp.]|nr:head GIN domain-containing protein [Lacibacter sp.]
MNTIKFSALLLVFISIVFTSCKKEIIRGKGDIVTQERTVSGFSRVKITGITDITLIQGSSFRVTVSDYENLVNEVETALSGDELRVGYKRNVWVTKGKSKAIITLPSLKGVRVDGSGDFIIDGPFTGTDFFSVEINGSGNVSINNAIVEEADIHISGSGDVRNFGLQCKKATVKVSGSGNTELTVSELLDVRIDGSGDVYYKGTPAVNARINGSGKVVKK